jgi:ATP-binding cassette subfamily B multidrug efflux pump
MTGRISDAYTNITTVKLFSPNREAHFARAAMEDFKHTGFRQMRLVSQFEIVNQALVVALDPGAAAPCGGTRAMSARRGGGDHRHGVAYQWHVALDHVANDFAVRKHRHRAGWHGHPDPGPKVQDAGCRRAGDLWRRGDLRQGEFNYNGEGQVLDGLSLSIRPARRSVWWALRCRQIDADQPAAAFL